MPIYTIRANGKVVEVRAPDEASAIAAAQQASQAASPKSKVVTSPLERGLSAINQGLSFGFADELEGALAFADRAGKNVNRRILGEPITQTASQAYQQAVSGRREDDAGFRQRRPVTSTALTIGGAILSPGSLASGRFVGGARSLPQAVGRSAAVGASYGAVAGAGSAEGGIEQRARGAAGGAALGAVAGAALPVAGRAAQAIGNVGNRVAQGVARRVGAVAPEDVAFQRLTDALRRDGLDPQQIQEAIVNWRASGASPAALLNVGGDNTRRLIGAAANRGGAAGEQASGYARQVAGDLQDEAQRLTGELTQDARSIPQVANALEDAQGALARETYAAPYAQRVALDEQTVQALSGGPGRAALQRARQAAEARLDDAQVGEIDALLAGNADEVSGATLDRIRIAMRGRAQDAMARPGRRDIASGLNMRTGLLDESLDAVPGLSEARGAYRGMQAQREALDLGSRAMNMPTRTYAEELAARTAISPEAQRAAGTGFARSIEEQIGSPAAGSTGFLNRLSSGNNMGERLSATYGPEVAGRYQQGISNQVRQLQDARRIDPGTNSQTFQRLQDSGLVDLPAIPTSKIGIITAIWNRIRSGQPLNDAERAELVSIGIQDAETAVQRLAPYFERTQRQLAPVAGSATAPLVTSMTVNR